MKITLTNLDKPQEEFEDTSSMGMSARGIPPSGYVVRLGINPVHTYTRRQNRLILNEILKLANHSL
jgi:hypothetical protein